MKLLNARRRDYRKSIPKTHRGSKALMNFVWRGKKKDCAKCSFTYFESELVKDGISGNLVCKMCYDPPEQKNT